MTILNSKYIIRSCLIVTDKEKSICIYVTQYATFAPSYPDLKRHLLGMAGSAAAIVSLGSFWALSFPGSAAR